MARAVYFDLDGTLVEFNVPYGRLLVDAFDSADVADPESAAEVYGDRFHEHFESFADDPYRAAAADAVEACDVDADPETVAEALVRAELDATVLRDGAREAVGRLADAHAVGVLTNGVPHVQRGKLEQVGLADAFDTVVVSYEVGAHKPDPAIFAAARERLDGDAYVYVGDDYEHDVAPARDAGFLGVHAAADEDGIVTSAGFDDLLALGELFSN